MGDGAPLGAGNRIGTKLCEVAAALCIAATLAPGPTLADPGDATAHAIVDAGLALAAPAIARETAERAAGCDGPDDLTNLGLRVSGHAAVESRVLDEIDGAARAAGTTGGLGGQVVAVTSAEDYLPHAETRIPGSLRDAVDRARSSGRPTWIVFDRALRGQTIELKAALRPGDNLTMDASCSHVTLIARPEIPLIVIKDHRNIVLTRLTLLKHPYTGENKGRADGLGFRDCITVSGNVDALAILHNDFGACGDGQIDITGGVGKPVPTMAGRITVAFNRFGKHDKASLLGTYGCEDSSTTLAQGCDTLDWLGGSRHPAPAYQVSFQGNLYLWTGQRHPRLYGLVWAQAINNVYAFEPYDRGNGTSGAAYGQYVADGARFLSEDNVYLGVGGPQHPPLGVYTINSAHAEASPGDVEGIVAARGNLVNEGVFMAENRPDLVLSPERKDASFDEISPSRIGSGIDVRAIGMRAAIACVAARAGVAGGGAWMTAICGPIRAIDRQQSLP